MTFRAFILSLAACIAMAPPAAVAQQPSPPSSSLSLEQQTLLRCSAAFAIGARRQAEGDPQALGWPPLAERGSEYFVRASAKVMDEAGLTREAIIQALSGEARALGEAGALERVMPACLLSLESSGL